MKVKALKSFTGAISMYAGEVRDIRTQIILDDLTAAGYIEPVTPRRMRASEIALKDICRQIRTEEAYLTEEDRQYLEILLPAAMDYVKGYTGLDEAAIDTHEDITIAVLVLVSDMYDNRQMTVDKNNVNRVVDTILGMYCVNLL